MDVTNIILEKSIELLRRPALEIGLGQLAGKLPTPSSRVVEVPWVASRIGLYRPARLLDIGLSLASIAYLGVLLEYGRAEEAILCAVDIISPSRVRSRYPEQWWERIEALDVRQADIRTRPQFDRPFDMVTCISVIEHIGFDEASETVSDSAFARAAVPEEVIKQRPDNVDGETLDAILSLLASGGRLAISVPMGQGGGVLLKDSLGYYCAQWEYSPSDWRRLVDHPGFELEESLFFQVDDDFTWKQVLSADFLKGLEAVQFSHSRGVGMAILRKK